ncbi:efflux transporter [Obba rivulosa]|uniref:Efflux transporter n=1 Tax=Obba rivulosa TaxID=1052685 RepID=A0A8E2AZ33_9APHY|nr:efflux transporter [Obba rivulosa]
MHGAETPENRSTLQAMLLVTTCTTAMILNVANSAAVFLALPTMGRDLNIPAYRLQWISSAYSLSSGCLLLFFGRLADLHGRKLTFLLGSAFLTVLGLACGFAKNEVQIDILRGLQGLGGAACIPAALGILAHAFPPSRTRSIAFATFAAGGPVGAAIGNLIGGFLTQLSAPTWRSTFYFLAGLSALCFVGGLLSFDRDPPSTEADRRIDWLGAFLVTAGLVFIVFVLSDGSIAPDGWKTGYIIALLIVGVLLLALYVAWEYLLERVQDTGTGGWWSPPPLMRVSIWGRAQGQLAVILSIAFLEWCSFISWVFWIELYYQNYLQLTPILTMVRLMPMCATGVLCNLVVALVVGRVPVVYLIATGTALTAVANLLFAVIDPTAPYWAFGFPAAVLSVTGGDFAFSAGTLFVAKVCLPHEQSVGGALFQTLTQLGGAFGLAISTIVYNSRLTRVSLEYGVVVNMDGTNAPAPAQLLAIKDAMWAGFAFGILGSLLAISFLRGAGIIGHKGKAQVELKGGSAEAEKL